MENFEPQIVGAEAQAAEEASAVSLRDIWSIFVNHWKWFVLSAVLFLLGGALYVQRIVPTYSRNALVLIKEDSRSRSQSIMDVSSSFSDMGFGLGRVNVNNEKLSFLSPDLMLQVVRNLDLDVNYRTKGLFHDHPLYGSSLPITVQFLTVDFNEHAAVTVSPKDSMHVSLSHFAKGKLADEETVIVAAYGDTTLTPAGKLVVKRNQPAQVLDLKEPVMVTRTGYKAAAAACRGRLSADLTDKQSTVINLSYRDVNVQLADDVLWMVINVYNENWMKDKNLVSISTNKFIAERLSIIEQELGSVDKTITSFRSSHRMPSNSAVSVDMQISTEAGRQLVELNNQLSIARLLRAEIEDAPMGDLLPSNVGLNAGETQSLISQYNNGTLRRNRLIETSSEENLLVKDIEGMLASLRVAILQSLDNYMRSVNIQIQSTEKVQSKSDARVSDMPLKAGQLLSEERQQKVKESLYLFLLQKREENELSQAFTAYTTRVIASPGGSSAPVAPNKKMILLVALVLGLAIPFGHFYLIEVLNTTVRGRKDLDHMAAPFLGELPSIAPRKHFVEKVMERLRKQPNPDELNRKLVVKAHSRDVINEAFRVVRTNLEFMQNKQEGCQVIMVTSFNAGSGKTFVSSNLAAALSLRHRRVLAIDVDLRKRTLSLLAGKPHQGLTDYLSGKSNDLDALIVKGVGGTSLDVLPVGKMPPNPAELLAEPRMEEMIQTLRGRYDVIFLDCPPLEIVTDADVVAPLADYTIITVRAGLLERAMLPQIDRFYQAKRYNGLCVLLNGTEGAGHYGYRYGYKYGYAYGKYGQYGTYGYGTYYGSSAKDQEKENEA